MKLKSDHNFGYYDRISNSTHPILILKAAEQPCALFIISEFNIVNQFFHAERAKEFFP